MKYKNGVRQHLFGLDGFNGFKLANLTPNMTRRAQVCTWLLYYREALMGKSLDELRAERAARQSQSDDAGATDSSADDEDVEAENLRLRRSGQSIRLVTRQGNIDSFSQSPENK